MNGCQMIPYRISLKKIIFLETAFTVKNGVHYELRWFTPGGEIGICVAMLPWQTAFVLFRFIEKNAESLTFATQSGGTFGYTKKVGTMS